MKEGKDKKMVERRRNLEAILFVADRALSLKKIAGILELPVEECQQLLREIREDYLREERGFQLKEVAGGYRLFTHPEAAPYVEKLVCGVEAKKLTQAALETLAIIAYRQPVTKSEVSAIRGVDSGAVIQTLIEKNLIKEVGRKEALGNPILLGTTSHFLEVFGLNSLNDLPPLDEGKEDRKA